MKAYLTMEVNVDDKTVDVNVARVFNWEEKFNSEEEAKEFILGLLTSDSKETIEYDDKEVIN